MITIDTTCYDAAELRAVARFFEELAAARAAKESTRLGGTPTEALGQMTGSLVGGTGQLQNAAAELVAQTEVKPSRKKKDVAPEPAAATEPAAAAPAEVSVTNDAPATADSTAPALTHDDVRKTFAACNEAGKREEAKKIVMSVNDAEGKPCNGVSKLPESALASVNDALKALLA